MFPSAVPEHSCAVQSCGFQGSNAWLFGSDAGLRVNRRCSLKAEKVLLETSNGAAVPGGVVCLIQTWGAAVHHSVACFEPRHQQRRTAS